MKNVKINAIIDLMSALRVNIIELKNHHDLTEASKREIVTMIYTLENFKDMMNTIKATEDIVRQLKEIEGFE